MICSSVLQRNELVHPYGEPLPAAESNQQESTPDSGSSEARRAPLVDKLDRSAGEALELYSDSQRDALYSEFVPLVHKLIRQYGDDAEMRADLEGEIYCIFTSMLNAYDPHRGVPLKPYLVRQITAATYTYARRRWRRNRRELVLDSASPMYEKCDTLDPSSEWDHQLVMRELMQKLPQLIVGLPERQRRVVIWRYYDSRSFEEIAGDLNIQVATARSLLRHGLNNIRARLQSAHI